MGCQHKITNQIKDKDNDYILALKGNPGTLHEDVKLYLDQEKDNLDIHIDLNKGYGRFTCHISTDIQWITERHPNWYAVESMIRIESERTTKDKTTSKTRYFLSSHRLNAEQILNKIRGHWAIENSLHWVLNMSFGKDQSTIRMDNAPQAIAIVRHIALNLIQLFKEKYPKKRYSMKRLRKMAGWDNSILMEIISQDP